MGWSEKLEEGNNWNGLKDKSMKIAALNRNSRGEKKKKRDELKHELHTVGRKRKQKRKCDRERRKERQVEEGGKKIKLRLFIEHGNREKRIENEREKERMTGLARTLLSSSSFLM